MLLYSLHQGRIKRHSWEKTNSRVKDGHIEFKGQPLTGNVNL